MKKLNPLLASWVPELDQIRSVLEGLFLLAWLKTGRPMPLVNVRVASFGEVDSHPTRVTDMVIREMEANCKK